MAFIQSTIKVCTCCGSSRIGMNKVLWKSLIDEWQLSSYEVEYVDRQQGLHCQECYSNLRSMALAVAVMKCFGYEGLFKDFVKQEQVQKLRILEINEAGNLTKFLSQIPEHTLTNYPEVDVMHLPFPDESFDLVLHSDTLEHVNYPIRALSECYRVLKSGKFLAYTIPIIVDRLTLSRAGLPPSYHAGSTDLSEVLVYTEYGCDAWKHLIQAGFSECRIYSLDYPSTQALVGVKLVSAYIDNVNDQLKAVDAGLRFRLQNTQAELERLQSQLQQTQTEKEQLHAQMQHTQVELQGSQSLIQQTQTEKEQLHAQMQHMQAALERSQSQLQQAEIELERSQSQLQQTEIGLERSQVTISAMESSKFWRLRSQWFKLRKMLGLKDDAMPFFKNKLNKLDKLKQIWQTQGTQGILRFLYQRIKYRFISRIDYQRWIANNRLTKQDIAFADKQMTEWQLCPKFSVIMPVYNVEAKWLKKAIESVRNQIYPYWELCIADDASTQTHIRSILKQYSKLDFRIKVVFRSENGNISAASNSALELATGEYIALLDNDDELAIDALFENAKLINRYPSADFIYSDEDKIDPKGNRLDPFFKPDWSPEYFHACMYTCHLGVYRTSLIREVGGFRSEYDGSQDYDLVLRVVEKTQNIYHIPRILYHWRVIPSSVTAGEKAKPWAYIAARRALESMLERSAYPGCVEETPRPGFFRVRRDIVGQPLVSIIIPSAGKTIDTPEGSLCLLENCLSSIQQLSTYRNFEIVVVDGYDIPESTLQAIASPNFHLVRCAEPFNFSMRINRGAARAKGQFLLLLNDDVEVVTPDWLESMVELAQQTEIGAVGAKLFFPDGKIQHVGVMILGGNPGHAFHGFADDHPGYFCSSIVNRNYLAVTAACMMIRQDLFQQLGGLDEEFPLNYNDVDLCLKAHQAGYRNVVTPYAQLIHYESASRQKGLRPGEWERLNNKWKNYFNTLAKDPYYNSNLSLNAANFELI